eukprot:CAMPEP_0172449970 /NCGR_PEP_ID=MMETSP1065-20121228/8521_1 /TAXON_ID=265537 /ORGANISM="Amphiprora paludosa, Strain CCMP125" /LENGTH=896 /DNA_ID=CAMNT_0013201733 /DNA_START=27 /DNA_END=2717 /DNA_ORIENTATION=-
MNKMAAPATKEQDIEQGQKGGGDPTISQQTAGTITSPESHQEEPTPSPKEMEHDTSSHHNISAENRPHQPAYKSVWFIVCLIAMLGTFTSGAFVALGVISANRAQEDEFNRSAQDLVQKVEAAWDDYVTAASWIHGQCRDRTFDRMEFRQMFEYFQNAGLDFQAMQFDPNITHDDRDFYEQEARDFYAEYHPQVNYRGFIGFNTANATSLEPRWPAPFYFPIHYMEPIVGNEAAIDLDYHASGSRKRTVLSCMEFGQPALTDRLRLVQETEAVAYGVVLMHPGVNVSMQEDVWPKDLASIVIRIPDLLRRAGKDQGEDAKVYLYDNDDSTNPPLFLGAARVVNQGLGQGALLVLIDEITLSDLRKSAPDLAVEEVIKAANKNWTVVVHAVDGTFEASHLIPVLGGCIIFVAAACLAYWVVLNTRRIEELNRMQAAADSERAALIIENANQAAKAERELNDFIAHEVRNPVAAAMAATSFVKTAINQPEPLQTEEARACTRDDVNIISNALKFVNDLLRNMLDMHRASNKQMKVTLSPADLLHDVIEPVHAMLQQRGTKIKFILECPSDIYVKTDRLRLKQVLLNLGRNSVKFVEEGFVRLQARVVDNNVELSVDDSGPGVPEEKRDKIFSKFQESLDMLSQGTGIGLHLCKNLVDLMGGDIYLDTDYHSGIEGYPGSRFVVRLNQPPLDSAEHDGELHNVENAVDGVAGGARPDSVSKTEPLSDNEGEQTNQPLQLPNRLSVLFCDDDPILRKLFIRTARTVAPDWEFRQASNGETAIKLAQEHSFDLVFMDMYMASVEKQLLGTETVTLLRRNGYNNRICGLSANDKESEFLEAGADVFSFKPFPCEAKALTQELFRILYYRHPGSEVHEIVSRPDEPRLSSTSSSPELLVDEVP